MSDTLAHKQLSLWKEPEDTLSSDAKLLEVIRQDLIGVQRIKTVDQLVVMCIRLQKYIGKQNPYDKNTKQTKAAIKQIQQTNNFIVCWLREFTCEACGLVDETRALHFHHTDPTDKKYEVGSTQTGLEKKIRESLKCIYLCEICHYKEHKKLGDMYGYFDSINRLGHNYLQNLLGLSG